VRHDDRGAHLQHRQVAAPERRALVRRRHQLPHPRDERLRRPGLLLVLRLERLVDRDDELGQGPQPREPEAPRGDLQELGPGQAAAVALEVDALGLEQLPVQIEQGSAECGQVVDVRSVADRRWYGGRVYVRAGG
jgi:hypothetical protein